MTPIRRRLLGLSALSSLSLTSPRLRPQTLRNDRIALAVIEGLSGPFANAGNAVLNNLQFAVDRVNAQGGIRLGSQNHLFELHAFDSKGQLDEAISMFRKVTDRGMPFVLQGNSSAIAGGLIDATHKHNERNPKQALLFLNYAAVEPSLTQESCSPWHFRFDAHAGMRMQALIEALASDASVRKVWLINQDYSFGQQVARLARQWLKALRPDIEILGDELHPMGRIKDFAPQASKIKASGADTVITGNWGMDLVLLIRAARDVGLDARYYTFYGNSLGTPAAIGDAGIGRVHAVAEWHANQDLPAAEAIYREFRARLRDPRQDYFNMRHVLMLDMLARAIEAAGSVQASAVAHALEGRRLAQPYAVTMRKEDHQLLTPQVVMVMQGPGTGMKYDVEGSGFGFRTEKWLSAEKLSPPVRCKMGSTG